MGKLSVGRCPVIRSRIPWARMALSFAGPTWKRFEILFVYTRQDPGNLGYKPPGDRLSADKLTAMAIQINADYSTGSARARDFEIWIDDVTFIR